MFHSNPNRMKDFYKSMLPMALMAMAATSAYAQEGVEPTITTSNDTAWYVISTPRRDNQTLTSAEADGENAKATAMTREQNQLWCLLPAMGEDGQPIEGKFVLYNRGTKLYLEPQPTGKLADDRTVYSVKANMPTNGMTFSMDDQSTPYYVITGSDGEQMNMGTPNDPYVFQWTDSSDPGNRFMFTKVKDPKRAILEGAIADAENLLNTTTAGDELGQYPESARETLQNAINTATTVEELTRAMDVYRQAMVGLQADVKYFIRSASSAPNRNGRVLYATSSQQGRYMRFTDKSLDMDAMWMFEPTEDGMGYYLKNVGRSTEENPVYAFIPEGNSQAVTVANSKWDASIVKLKPITGNQFAICSIDNETVQLHFQLNHHLAVKWAEATQGGGSAMTIEKVTAEELSRAEAIKAAQASYKEVWKEEFDNAGQPSATDWTAETGFVRNQELQWYKAENATVADGNLMLTAKKETVTNPNYDAASEDWKINRQQADYTSASLTTKGKHQWKFGRFTVKATLPQSAGLWSAVRFFGDEAVTGAWPNTGEIDFVDAYKDRFYTTMTWGNSTPSGVSNNVSGGHPYTLFSSDFVTQPHEWRMDWTSEAVKMYIDGELLFVTNLARTNNGTDATAANPFLTEQYLQLGLAVGAKGGTPSAEFSQDAFKIDYVKVEQIDDATGVKQLTTSASASSVVRAGKGSLTFLNGGVARVYTTSGATVWNGVAKAGQTITLPAGLYIANGQKVLVR